MAITTRRRISYEIGAIFNGLLMGCVGGYCAIVYVFHSTVRVALGVTAVTFCIACLLWALMYIPKFRARYSGSVERRPNTGTPAVVRRNLILLLLAGTAATVAAILNVIAFAPGRRYSTLLGALTLALSLLFAWRLRSYRRSTGKADLLQPGTGANRVQTKVALSLLGMTYLAAAFMLAGIFAAMLESIVLGLVSISVGVALEWLTLRAIGRAVATLGLPEYSDV